MSDTFLRSIINFDKLTCAGLINNICVPFTSCASQTSTTFNPLQTSTAFMSTFSSTGPGPSDPRLLLYVFDFIFDSQLIDDTIEKFVESEAYHYLYGYGTIILLKQSNYYLSNISKKLYSMVKVWKITPANIFFKIFRLLYSRMECLDFADVLYLILITSSKKEHIDMLLKEYTEIFEPTQHQPHLLPYIIDQNVFRLGGRTCTLCDHYFNDVPNAKKQIDPDIDLYLHKILLHNPKYGVPTYIKNKPEISKLGLENHISLCWQRHIMRLQEFIDTFHVCHGYKIVFLIQDLIRLNDEKLILFWIGLGAKDAHYNKKTINQLYDYRSELTTSIKPSLKFQELLSQLLLDE